VEAESGLLPRHPAWVFFGFVFGSVRFELRALLLPTK
jgi:hypothetical protein